MASVLKRRDTDMTEGSIPRLLIYFALPLMIGNVFQQLYNTVDTLIVGNFVGTQALAAVGATSSFVQLLVGLFVGLSSMRCSACSVAWRRVRASLSRSFTAHMTRRSCIRPCRRR